MNVLVRIREQLLQKEDADYLFPRFDAAIRELSKRQGLKIELKTKDYSLLKGNPWLGEAEESLSLLDIYSLKIGIGLGTVLGVFLNTIMATKKKIDLSSHITREEVESLDQLLVKQNGNNSLSLTDIYERIQEFFILDLQECLSSKHKNKPLVFFIDTYEQFTNNVMLGTSDIIRDEWLFRSTDAIMKKISGVLWVVMGRDPLVISEKDNLFWNRNDINDEQILEQTNLEFFGEEDSQEYLTKEGITNPILISQLHSLTEGLPLFLKITADTYRSLMIGKSEDYVPRIEEFGKDKEELLRRYYKCLKTEYKLPMIVLAILGKWDTDLIQYLCSSDDKNYDDNFKHYVEELTNNSFIISDKDKYYLHSIVRDVIRSVDDCHIDIVRRVKSLREKYYYDSLMDSYNSAMFSEYIKWLCDDIYSPEEALWKANSVVAIYYLAYAEDCSESHFEFEKICGTLFHKYYKKIDILDDDEYDNEYFDDLCNIYSILCDIIQELIYRGHTYRTAVYKVATTPKELEMCSISKELFEKAYSMSKDIIDKKKIIDTLVGIAFADLRLKNIESAREMLSEAIEISENEFGKEHANTLELVRKVADEYRIIGDYNEAISLLDYQHQTYNRLLGENHPYTQLSMIELSTIYFLMNDYQNSQEIFDRLDASTINQRYYYKLNTEIVKKYAVLYYDSNMYDSVKDYLKSRNYERTVEKISNEIYSIYDSSIKKYNDLKIKLEKC